MPPVEGAPVEGAPVEGAPGEGAPVEGAPVEGAPVEGAPVEGAPVEGAPAPTGPMGTVKGVIVDPDTNEGAVGATITTGGADSQTIFAEADGTYSLSLPPGQYELQFEVPGGTPTSRKVTIVADAVQTVDIVPELSTEVIAIEDTGIDTSTASGQLAARRASSTIGDLIGAQEIARTPDSNSGDVVKRMPGATIQDNKYVVVRGLGGRYSLTLLNGIPVPSPDPDVPAAPLDLFPASMVSGLKITKSFSPDQQGNFAGGALSIDTRSYPKKFMFSAKASLAADSESSLRTVRSYNGGSFDALGFDDGTRAMPSQIPSTRLVGDPNLTPEQRAAETASFGNDWTLSTTNALPNFGFGLTLGDTVKIAGRKQGYVATMGYGLTSTRKRTHIARVGERDGDGYLPSVLQLDDIQGSQRANLSGLASTSIQLNEDHQVNLLAMYSHSAEDSASQVNGTANSSSVIERTRLRFVERSLTFFQLVGDDKLSGSRVKLGWQGNLALVGQREPDTRDLLRTQTPDGLVIDRSAGGAERLYSELDDTTGGGGADVTVRLNDQGTNQIKVGVAISSSSRDYQARRFHFDVTGTNATLAPGVAFNPANAGNGLSVREATLPSDGYAATRTVSAAYAQADVQPTSKLHVLAGARFETAALDIGLASKIDLMAPPTVDTSRRDNAVMPSVNASYDITGNSKLRAGYGLTVARPNFREVAPALYYDYVRLRAIGGNPNLEQTTIHNFDVRWETYLGTSELLAASLFAKRFVKPIERTLEEAGDGQNVSFSNADGADSYGVELEAKLSLSRLAPALAAFSVGGNFSLIGSKIDVVGEDRPLQGQSPYVVNVGLGYASKIGTQVDLLFNSFGRRIEEVGTGGAGNIYEEPFHRLDFSVTQKLSDNLKFKLSGTNLLNQRVVRTQNGVEILAYPVGFAAIGSVELNVF